MECYSPTFEKFSDFFTKLAPKIVQKIVQYSVDHVNYSVLEKLFESPWFNRDATTDLSDLLRSPAITHALLCMNISEVVDDALFDNGLGIAFSQGGAEIKIIYENIIHKSKLAPLLPPLNAALRCLRLFPSHGVVLVFKTVIQRPFIRIKLVQIHNLRLKSLNNIDAHHLPLTWYPRQSLPIIPTVNPLSGNPEFRPLHIRNFFKEL